MKKKRLFYLDFVRAIAVIFIVLWHFNTTINEFGIDCFNLSRTLRLNCDIGQIGVTIFFILSGASLMYTYKDDLEIKSYFRKRFFSIYPMFWIAYGAAFLYFFYKNGMINRQVQTYKSIFTVLGLDGYLYNLTSPNYYILGEWFLGCIIIFYMIFPILRKLILKYPKSTFAIFTLYYICITQLYSGTLRIDWNLLIRIYDILLGMYFVLYINKIKFNKYIFVGALLSSIILLKWQLVIKPIYLMMLSGGSVFIVLIYLGKKVNNKHLINIINNLSKYSYAIFLVHHVITMELFRKFSGKMLENIELICLILITCIFIYLFSKILYKITNKLISNMSNK